MNKVIPFLLLTMMLLFTSLCHATDGNYEQYFKTIYFDFDSASLTQTARDQLKIVAEEMKKRPGINIQLEGHTDERGSSEYSQAAGERRAKSAASYLIFQGVSEKRISALGIGKSRPAVEGHNEAAWAKNRRVEIVIRRE